MKPFNASEFISNQETPVVSRSGKPIEIVTVKARGTMKVVGYAGSDVTLSGWFEDGRYTSSNPPCDWDLFFAPKVEVVHVYPYRDDPNGRYTFVQSGDKFGGNANVYTYLGTITGPIVPPEKESGVAK
mgnify:FL=1